MARPVVSGDNETIREALVHKTHVYVVEPANPEALAGAIRELIGNPELRELIAGLGHEYYSNHHTIKAIGAAMEKVLRSLVQSTSRRKKMGASVSQHAISKLLGGGVNETTADRSLGHAQVSPENGFPLKIEAIADDTT